jgi:hypothetical protein
MLGGHRDPLVLGALGLSTWAGIPPHRQLGRGPLDRSLSRADVAAGADARILRHARALAGSAPLSPPRRPLAAHGLLRPRSAITEPLVSEVPLVRTPTRARLLRTAPGGRAHVLRALCSSAPPPAAAASRLGARAAAAPLAPLGARTGGTKPPVQYSLDMQFDDDAPLQLRDRAHAEPVRWDAAPTCAVDAGEGRDERATAAGLHRSASLDMMISASFITDLRELDGADAPEPAEAPEEATARGEADVAAAPPHAASAHAFVRPSEPTPARSPSPPRAPLLALGASSGHRLVTLEPSGREGRQPARPPSWQPSGDDEWRKRLGREPARAPLRPLAAVGHGGWAAASACEARARPIGSLWQFRRQPCSEGARATAALAAAAAPTAADAVSGAPHGAGAQGERAAQPIRPPADGAPATAPAERGDGERGDGERGSAAGPGGDDGATRDASRDADCGEWDWAEDYAGYEDADWDEGGAGDWDDSDEARGSSDGSEGEGQSEDEESAVPRGAISARQAALDALVTGSGEQQRCCVAPGASISIHSKHSLHHQYAPAGGGGDGAGNGARRGSRLSVETAVRRGSNTSTSTTSASVPSFTSPQLPARSKRASVTVRARPARASFAASPRAGQRESGGARAAGDGDDDDSARRSDGSPHPLRRGAERDTADASPHPTPSVARRGSRLGASTVDPSPHGTPSRSRRPSRAERLSLNSAPDENSGAARASSRRPSRATRSSLEVAMDAGSTGLLRASTRRPSRATRSNLESAFDGSDGTLRAGVGACRPSRITPTDRALGMRDVDVGVVLGERRPLRGERLVRALLAQVQAVVDEEARGQAAGGGVPGGRGGSEAGVGLFKGGLLDARQLAPRALGHAEVHACRRLSGAPRRRGSIAMRASFSAPASVPRAGATNVGSSSARASLSSSGRRVSVAAGEVARVSVRRVSVSMLATASTVSPSAVSSLAPALHTPRRRASHLQIGASLDLLMGGGGGGGEADGGARRPRPSVGTGALSLAVPTNGDDDDDDDDDDEPAEIGAGALDLLIPSLDAAELPFTRRPLGAGLSDSEADAQARRFAERMHGPGHASGALRPGARPSLAAATPRAADESVESHPLAEGCAHLCMEAGLFGAACSREQALAIVPAFSVRSVERYVRVYREGSVGSCMLIVLRGSVVLKSFDGGLDLVVEVGGCIGEEALWLPARVPESMTIGGTRKAADGGATFKPLPRLCNATAGELGAVLLAIPAAVRAAPTGGRRPAPLLPSPCCCRLPCVHCCPLLPAACLPSCAAAAACLRFRCCRPPALLQAGAAL